MTEAEFNALFEKLTGVPPLSWQRRLFLQHFAQGEFCSTIDLPTGLGKTMVMAIWMIARIDNPSLPRRLIYVVDRRTVVDQATDLATRLVENWRDHGDSSGKPPVISTLRGQYADNRKWSEDLSRPAIIIGTVDLIGSALLFSGYRSSFKRRPLEAGLLGQDSLLVLDEAHLSKPFDKLLGAIEGFSTSRNPQGAVANVNPIRVTRMSATSEGSTDLSSHFTLQLDANGELTGDDAKDEVIRDRFSAYKQLKIKEFADVNDSIADAAGTIATEHPGSRVVIFVKSPKDVDGVRKALLKKDKTRETQIAQLTGTMRGLERDELVDLKRPLGDNEHERRVMQRFLSSDNNTSLGGCFLISTSAGEVGFDLNADHMVCDAAPLDSMIQRLGRVNRRGLGKATVILVKKSETVEKNDFDRACNKTTELLTDGMDVSPKALAAFKTRLANEKPEVLKAASTPVPTMVELTDILLDAWSMTSIIKPMPGRPEVGPWLRGVEQENSRTAIAWRAELELFSDEDGNAKDLEKTLKAIFTKHPIRPHETLSINSLDVIEFFKNVTKNNKRPELRDTRVAIKFSRNFVVTTIGKLIDDPRPLFSDPTLILPATFGGLDRGGMISADAIPAAPRYGEPPLQSLDVADKSGYERDPERRARLRILIEREDDSWRICPLPHGAALPADLNSDESHETSTRLFKSLEKSDFRVRLVQPVKVNAESDEVRCLVMLSPAPQNKAKEDQLLTVHVGAVVGEAERIIDELGLEEPARSSLLFAARWHDEGKRADIWQRFVFGPDQNGQPLGKAVLTRGPESLKGYRHEFGSLMRIHYPDRDVAECTLPSDPETRELALHLIATHHGSARPHFEKPFDRHFDIQKCDAIHVESIRRFARLQKKYGWWHLAWLENLLRCADALASADPDAEDDPDGTIDDEGGSK